MAKEQEVSPGWLQPGRAGWVWEIASLVITCAFQCWASTVSKDSRCAGEQALTLQSQSSSLCRGVVGVLAPLALSSPSTWVCARWRRVDNKKAQKRGSKITVILEKKEKPVSREAESDLPCILTIYGVLMGLFKSRFTLLFNKKHIYHSNHLGREELALPPRWRPPSKRATAGICNVIFCATYNVGGRGGGGGSEGGRSGVFGRGGGLQGLVFISSSKLVCLVLLK